MKYENPECAKCLYPYLEGCPCAHHCGCAACLMMFKNAYEWAGIFENVISRLKEYDSSNPQMDESVFIHSICDSYGITEREAIWATRRIRKSIEIGKIKMDASSPGTEALHILHALSLGL